MTDVPGPRPLGVRDVLRIPDFRRLFAAQAISDFGDGMTYLALFLLVLELTGSTAAIAVMAILIALPPVTIGLVAGAYADRLDRRHIMIVSDTVRAVVVVSMVLFATAEGLPVLYLLALTQAVVGTFFAPARTAMIPRVVPAEGLLAANSLAQMSRVVAGLLGTGVTGVIVAVSGVVWPAFLLDGATFFVSVGLVWRVTASVGQPDPVAAATSRARGIGSSVGEGLRFIAGSRPLLAVMSGIAVTMLGIGAVNVLFIPFLVGELGESPAWAAPVEGAQSLAMILASGIVAVIARRLQPPRIVVVGLLGAGALTVLLSLAGNAWGVMAVLFGIGWFVTPIQAATMTIVQRTTEDAARGRVAAAFNAATSTTSIASMAAAGILADLIGIRGVFAVGGLITIAAAILAALLFRGASVPEARARAAATPPVPVHEAVDSAA
jgi:MFS transporter, DHA3 family, macrolide efflux protein